jgi:hypothetical protein
MSNLAEMVDVPMREPVALLSLLGCQTIWSCCGYHYRDEPEGKSHMIGASQILLTANAHAFTHLCELMDNELWVAWPKWKIQLDKKPFQPPMLTLGFCFPVTKNDDWFNPQSAHYHEGPACAIQHLTNALRDMEHHMADEVIIVDSNAAAKGAIENWDFPASDDWVVRKSDYFGAEICAAVEAGSEEHHAGDSSAEIRSDLCEASRSDRLRGMGSQLVARSLRFIRESAERR